jgi:tRNA:m4X modification enzyme
MAASETASGRAAAKKCDFWLEKKNRKCGMLVKAGETRCGNHREHGPERVACAHCKTSVSALGLEKHLRKCPALAHATARTRAPYFVRDVNAGDASAASLAAAVASRPPRGDALRAFAARVRAACARERIEPGTPREDPRDNERCRLATRARRDAQRLAATRGGAVPPPLEPRHAAQHASIVAHMADAGLVHGTDDEDESSLPQKNAPHSKERKKKPLFVELGAGRGYLSHFLLDAYGPLDLVLVEREAVRFKAERSMGADAAKRRDAQINDERRLAQKRRASAKKTSPRQTFREDENVDEEVFDDLSAERDAETVRVRRAGASVERLRVDIKDLLFSNVAAAENRDVVFVAKHLCGAATDLALRCALAAPRDDSDFVFRKNKNISRARRVHRDVLPPPVRVGAAT